MNDALAILYAALMTRLKGADTTWGLRVYPEIAKPDADRPYVLIFWQGGGEKNAVHRKDASFTIGVKCVADTLTLALNGASALGELLNDKGFQDSPNDSVAASLMYGWEIKTITQTRRIHLIEQFENVQPVYHSGHSFAIEMEKINHG